MDRECGSLGDPGQGRRFAGLLRPHEQLGPGSRDSRVSVTSSSGIMRARGRSPRTWANSRTDQLRQELDLKRRRCGLSSWPESRKAFVDFAGHARDQNRRGTGIGHAHRPLRFLLGRGFPHVSSGSPRSRSKHRLLPQSLFDAPGRARSAGDQGSTRRAGLPIRRGLQRRGAVLGRDPEPRCPRSCSRPSRSPVTKAGSRGAGIRRHAERAALRRAAPWRHCAGNRQDRHAAGWAPRTSAKSPCSR